MKNAGSIPITTVSTAKIAMPAVMNLGTLNVLFSVVVFGGPKKTCDMNRSEYASESTVAISMSAVSNI